MNEILIIALLIILNGLFNMYEIAFVSSRKSKLEEKANKGNLSASLALKKMKKPERFLSEIQIGVTSISIITGAFGGIRIARHLTEFFYNAGFTAEYTGTVSLVIVIGVLTYFSLIIGELVPKTIALNNPEKITLTLTPFMRVVAAIVSPVAWFLSISTKFIIKFFRIKKNTDPPVTEEELKILIKQGSEHGVLEEQESEIIHDVFTFADKTAYSMMTPNKDVVWLDINDNNEEIIQTIISAPFSRFLVCNETIDKVLGIVYVKDILKQISNNQKLDIRAIMSKPFFIPETVKAIKLLEDFKKRQIKMGIVVNEYGETHGIITTQDISDNVLGDFPDKTQDHQPQLTKRDDGSLLVDGDYQFDEVMETLEIPEPDDFKEIKQNISTVGGFIMYMLNKVPVVGDHIHFENYRFEVVDMDANRVDKVLVVKEKNIGE
jgi:putative hemolysin